MPTKEKSDKLVIANHFLPGNRAGFPGHLKPWSDLGFGGFEVNFLPQYKALHEAGYNILCYDIRGHGRSGNVVASTIGLTEWRDVVASVRYAKSRSDTQNMKVSLLSICLGADSTFVAMHKSPEDFTHIKSMVALQPVSCLPLLEKMASGIGITYEQAVEYFDATYKVESGGFCAADLSPVKYAPAVTTPTLVLQVHEDSMTYPKDVESIFEALGCKEKKLQWIEGTTRRFDGYNFLGKEPEHMLKWFNDHV